MKNGIFALLFLFSFNACSTQLWGQNIEKFSIYGFYVDDQKNKLYVASNSDWFVFPVDENLQEVLRLSSVLDYRLSFNDWKMDRSNQISGKLSFFVYADSDGVRSGKLQPLGFIGNGDGWRDSYGFHTDLSGLRYQAQGSAPLRRLITPIKLDVDVPFGSQQLPAKLFLTPLAITYDAVTVPLMALVYVIAGGLGELK